MASSSSGSKFFVLQSSDGETFHVEEYIASRSDLIRSLIEQRSDPNVEHRYPNVIPLLDLNGNVLQKMIDYIKGHFKADNPEKKKDKGKLIVGKIEQTIDDWDDGFLQVENMELCDLFMAAHYLGILSLFDKILGKVANMIEGRLPEEIRDTFNIVNDFPPGEEQKIRNQHPWAFTSRQR